MSVQKLREAILDRFSNESALKNRFGKFAEIFEAPQDSGTPREHLSDELQAPRSGFDVYRTTLRYVFRHHRRLIGQLVGGALLSNMFVIVLPMFTMALYDRVIPHQAMETLWALAIGVTIALVLDLALRSVRLKLSDAIGLDASLQLQAHLYKHLMKMKMSQAPRTSGGVAQYIRDLDSFCQLMPQLVTAVVADLPFFVIVLILLYSLGGPVVFAPLVGIALLWGAYSLSYSNARRAYYDSMKLGRQQANMLNESIQALETVKSSSAQGKFLSQWEAMSDDNAFTGHKARYWGGFAIQASSTITQFVIVLVGMIGVYQVTQSLMTAGALSACILLVGRTLAPVNQAIALMNRLQHLNHVADGLVNFMAAPVDAPGSEAAFAARDISGAIDFHNVTFTYPHSAAPCLHRLNFSIKAGERIGLIGRVGSGKSTLLRLMTRLYDPTEGSILVDGYDAQQYDPEALRRDVGFMRQDPVLIDDTLENNITFGLENISKERFEEAVRLSGVKDFASRHPQGYSLRVGSGGENLSGGERQSVALARLLMQNPQVMLMDEPSAGFDTTLEAQLVAQLKLFAASKTLIISTHRTTLLALVDRIIWLENGRIIADGPRDEILGRMKASASQPAIPRTPSHAG
ncbi:MAG: ATP-binding cassette domain-containing protein [Pseudomonadota bacterium]